MAGGINGFGRLLKQEGRTLKRNAKFLSSRISSGSPGAAWSAIRGSTAFRRAAIGAGVGAGVSGVYGGVTGQGFFGSAMKGAALGGMAGGLSRPLGNLRRSVGVANRMGMSRARSYMGMSAAARKTARKAMSPAERSMMARNMNRVRNRR